MSKTYAKYGFLFFLLEDRSDVFYGHSAHAGITRTVAQEQAVVLGVSQIVVPWHDVHASATFQQTPQLIVFHSAVEHAHAGISVRIVRLRDRLEKEKKNRKKNVKRQEYGVNR